MGRLRVFRHLVILALVLLFAGWASAEVCKGSKVPKAELAKYDAQALLSPAEEAEAVQTHLPWGVPECPRRLVQREYIVCYLALGRVPVWAAYRLRAMEVVSRPRRDAFRTDPRLSSEESATCADYGGSGFDRGHLVPREDMNRSPAAQANTFFLSNMVPQIPAFNRGPWRRLEQLARTYAKKYGEVFIVTGATFEPPSPTVPSGRVTVPARFYKIFLRSTAGGPPEVLALALPQLAPTGAGAGIGPRPEKSKPWEGKADFADYLVSPYELEQLTGLTLFPKLDAESLKHAVASELWPRN